MLVRRGFQALLFGSEPMPLTQDWRKALAVGGAVVLDAKALFDHLTSTASTPQDKHTLFDLLGAKELVNMGVVSIRWVPTIHQHADCLTKELKEEVDSLRLVIERGTICLRARNAEEERDEREKAERRRETRQRGKMKQKEDYKPTDKRNPGGISADWCSPGEETQNQKSVNENWSYERPPSLRVRISRATGWLKDKASVSK